MLSVSAEQLQRFKELLAEEDPSPGCTPLTWGQLKSARCGEVVHLLTEYFPGRRAWEVARDIFTKMNQTELCLQMQRELNGERGSRTGWGGLGGWRTQRFLSRSCGPAEQGQVVECVCVCLLRPVCVCRALCVCFLFCPALQFHSPHSDPGLCP